VRTCTVLADVCADAAGAGHNQKAYSPNNTIFAVLRNCLSFAIPISTLIQDSLDSSVFVTLFRQKGSLKKGIFLTTEVVIADLPEPKKKVAAPMPEDYEYRVASPIK